MNVHALPLPGLSTPRLEINRRRLVIEERVEGLLKRISTMRLMFERIGTELGQQNGRFGKSLN